MGQDVIQASKIKIHNAEERIVEKFYFAVSGTLIPTLSEKPVKSLGKKQQAQGYIRNTCEEFGR